VSSPEFAMNCAELPLTIAGLIAIS